ncbi:MAG TPA: CDP-diacylglycerol--serine O-phosphatidyltransferase [Prolixibacteraceae bacterium]
MIKKHIPNFLTSLNVLCGSLAVVLILEGKFTAAVILIMLAAVFDFLDGLTARLLKAYSPIGKELDSLADMVSFGLAPGLIMFKLLEISLFKEDVLPDLQSNLSLFQTLIIGSAFLIPIFSALRLAKFNVDTRQTNSFIGLPTPANALFISSLALIQEHGTNPYIDGFLLTTPVLLLITFVFSFLLVSEIPMFSLKFKNLSFKYNQTQYIFVALAAILILTLQLYGIAATILLFIAISVFQMIKKK